MRPNRPIPPASQRRLVRTARRVLAPAVAAALALAACRHSEDAPAAGAPLPVRLETVEAGPFQPTLDLLGVVEPRDSVAVLARVTGPLRYPSAFGEGLRSGVEVREGQLLAWQRVARADHLIEVARLNAEAAASELERHREVWEQGLESDAVFETYKAREAMARQELRAAEAERAQLELRAPVAGRLHVEQRYPPGTEISAGAPLAEIVTDASQVRGWAGIADRGRIDEGQPVRIFRSGGEGPPVAGTLREVAPLGGRGGAFSVVVQPDDPAALPPPGEGVEIEILLEPRVQALTVPEQAVWTSADGSSVYVARRSRGELRAERRDVLLGDPADADGGVRIEVLRGLSRGDRVVVEGASSLADGMPIVEVGSPDAQDGSRSEG